MNTRTIAGLGMMLLAGGLLALYFLGVDFSGPSSGIDKDQESNEQEQTEDAPVPTEASAFLDDYNTTFKNLWTDAEAARWAHANNQTKELTLANANACRRLHDFTGNRAVIENLRQFRGRLDLTLLQDRQIETAWLIASQYPATSAEKVMELMDLELAMADSLKSVQPGIENTENAGTQDEKVAAWEASQVLGMRLKDDLVQARNLRNALAREMGFSSYFGLAAEHYGMKSEELLLLLDHVVSGIAPLYQQLHCLYKNELASGGGKKTGRFIPAHLVPTTNGLAWPITGTAAVAPAQLDSLFSDVQPQWILEHTDNFFLSLGFSPLPLGFWGKSNFYPEADGSGITKSNAAGTWHMDLDQDVRALMNVQADFTSYGEAHRVLGQAYYHLAFSRKEVPPILRQGASPALIPGLGTLMQLVGSSTPSLLDAGLMPPGQEPDVVELLLHRAINGSVLQIPQSCGTLVHWEYDLYEMDLPRHLFNTRWWEYSKKFQGIEPPAPQDEMACSPAIQANVIINPVHGMDEALGLVIAHQLHRYICRNLLDEDVRLANYRGRLDVGMYLQSVMQLGATKDWSQIMREATGEEISSAALLEYYQPLLDWLAIQNEGSETDFTQAGKN